MNSIRRTTTRLLAASLGTLIVAAGAGLYLLVRASLLHQFDDSLLARVQALRGITHLDRGNIEIDFSGETMPQYGPGREPEYFQAWRRFGDGRWDPFEQSESFTGKTWSLDVQNLPIGSPWDLRLPDGRAGRAIAVAFHPDEESDEHESDSPQIGANDPGRLSAGLAGAPAAPEVIVVTARGRGDLDRTMNAVATGIVLIGGGLLICTMIAARWALRRGLAPLASLSATVARIDEHALHQRLTERELPQELVPIASCLNRTLERLESAFARERGFTSAASHELRTPLAELRTMLEVALTRDRSAAEWRTVGEESLAVAHHLERLIELLLAVARGDARSDAPPANHAVDIGAVVLEEVARREPAARSQGIELRVERSGSPLVRSDGTVVRCVVGNLLDNALDHGDVGPGRPVECTVTSRNGHAIVTVRNAAPSLVQDDLAHLSEPFWRKDRARAAGHFGLGLAVSRSLVAAVGGELKFSLDTEGRLTAALMLAASDRKSSGSDQSAQARRQANPGARTAP